MSSNDFLNGRMAANFAHHRASVDADEAIDSWKDYSNKLQIELQKTEFNFVEATTQCEGLVRLVARMKEELKRLDPDNSLLRDEVRHQIYAAGVADKFQELRYDYDSERGVFRKRS